MTRLRRSTRAFTIGVLFAMLVGSSDDLRAGGFYFPAPVGPFLNPSTGHWYFKTSSLVNYSQGSDFADTVGGYLVSILDVAEQQWLISQFGTHPVSIGLTDEGSPGVFYWLSGEPVGFTDWAAGPPGASFEPRHARGLADWTPFANDNASQTVVEVETQMVAFLPALTCTGQLGGATIAWEAPGFDEVRILRDGQVIATLPASTGSFFDPAPPGYPVYMLAATGPAGTSLPAGCLVEIPDPDYTLHIPDVVSVHPGPATVPILLDHPVGDVQGFSFGVCFDTSALTLVSVEQGADLLAVAPGGADFYNAAAGLQGVTVGVVVDFFSSAWIPPGIDQELVVAMFESTLSAPSVELLDLCDTIGNPPVQVVVVVAGSSIVPVDVDGSVAFVEVQFRRGDGNVDGAIDLADVLFLGLRLFDPTVNDYPCREAFEVNGDALVDIADMVYTLSYLFIGGPPPGAPFPDCGPDPDPGTGFGCDDGTSCP